MMTTSFQEAAREAIDRLPPLWPLSNFVAVNPFLGFSQHDFLETALLLKKIDGISLSMPPSFYRERYQSGLITKEDLEQALEEHREHHFSLEEALAGLHEDQWNVENATSKLYPSAYLDSVRKTRWKLFITEEISKWSAAYFDRGQAFWSFPWKTMPLFKAWREAALRDAHPQIVGMKNWPALVASLPDDPLLLITEVSSQMGIKFAEATDIFYALLSSVAGWAGHLQFLAHESKLKGEHSSMLQDLLAIRLLYEMALWSMLNQQEKREQFVSPSMSDHDRARLSLGLLWQRTHEIALRRELFLKVQKHAASVPFIQEPALQAVFCIDVRSEVYRRALENVSSDIQTLGFAGFFGFPVASTPVGSTHVHAQCPVLLTPVATIAEQHPKKSREVLEASQKIKSAWRAFKSSAVSSFIFVEVCGFGFLWKMWKDSFLHSPPSSSSCCNSKVDINNIPLETQVSMAAGALKHMGFHQCKPASLILLCAHGSSSKNNPYASSLDCGACGGHSGEVNAKVAAVILNSPNVREKLSARGISIPPTTWFLAGVHNTTTEKVTLFQTELAPPSHQQEIKKLRHSLDQATHIAQEERAPSLRLSKKTTSLSKKIQKKSNDWSEVRPEWGLAGNYAFIAASRRHTRGLNLEGRVFLHDYDYQIDDNETTLELILSAPVVVASWINLQYFASTLDHQHFGSGDKTLHNMVGLLAVVEGNGGDIKRGLPFQSLHDGQRWRHDPIRLHVCVEAPREAIDRVLKKHSSVAELVSNHWIYLFAANHHFKNLEQSDGQGGWIAL